ncbi:hypothetical protein HAX54_035199, partial [Datura stramonium]|nr:hypothetical protein [Datura stramonium]
LGTTTIGYTPVRSGEMPMQRWFGLIFASAISLTPHYIIGSQIKTIDLSIYRRWNICYPSSMLITGSSS